MFTAFVMLIIMLVTIMTPPFVLHFIKYCRVHCLDSKNAPVMIMTTLFMTEPLRAHNSSSASHSSAADSP